MSVASQIQRIKNAVADAYDSVEEKGGTLPASETVANLATAIDSITAGSATPEWQVFLPSNAPNIKAILDADTSAYTSKVIVLFSVVDGETLTVGGADQYSFNGGAWGTTNSWTIPDNSNGLAYVAFRSSSAISVTTTSYLNTIAYYSTGNSAAQYSSYTVLTPCSSGGAKLAVIAGSGENITNAISAWRNNTQIKYLDGIDLSTASSIDLMFFSSNCPIFKCVLDMRGATAAIDRPFGGAYLHNGLPSILCNQSVSFASVINFSNTASLARFDADGAIVGGLVYDINTCANSGMTLTFNAAIKAAFTATQWTAITDALYAKNWGISPT